MKVQTSFIHHVFPFLLVKSGGRMDGGYAHCCVYNNEQKPMCGSVNSKHYDDKDRHVCQSKSPHAQSPSLIEHK